MENRVFDHLLICRDGRIDLPGFRHPANESAFEESIENKIFKDSLSLEALERQISAPLTSNLNI